ncbi:hypothetical protein Sps_04853 [Shewanella psychrophila]|uniref:YecA family protein n=1 Tax=Shewanella psychrophila TaxID=225848 RepID=A0A1S6HWJ8_9GAMM|nr:UPF0149 family protein [Shewanella psychrophila]AQS39935.1 hypothetical protein Sps_04853 [Shewanella psychrophila]
MATPPSLRIDNLLAALNEAEIGQTPVEVHGALTGIICGGVEQAKGAWSKPLLELMNDGQSLPDPLSLLIEELYQDTIARVSDIDFGFSPMLPEEEEPLSNRVEALTLWVQSFLTGIAMVQPKIDKASADVQEVIKDLADIALVEFDVVEDEESEAAYMELMEFTKLAALLCYSEFGPDLTDPNQKEANVIH